MERRISEGHHQIRFPMCHLKMNSRKEEEQPLCPLCAKENDTTEHVLQFD